MIRNGCKRCVSVEVKSPDHLEHALRSLKRKLKKEEKKKIAKATEEAPAEEEAPAAEDKTDEKPGTDKA